MYCSKESRGYTYNNINRQTSISSRYCTDCIPRTYTVYITKMHVTRRILFGHNNIILLRWGKVVPDK